MENQGPRKATDVLLDLESKLDNALNIIKAQDLNMKLLSNKLNILIEKLDKQPIIGSFSPKPQFTVEAVPSQFMQPSVEDKEIPISPEHKLLMENAPVGFRRTSRPETYAGDNAYLQKSPPQEPVSVPIQTIKPPPGRGNDSEIVVPPQAINQDHFSQKNNKPQLETPKLPQEQFNQGAIPVEQRVVDKNSKSVFLADVEIVDLKTGNQIFKTRTSGNGKWSAPLSIGNYRVTISKRESVTKQKIEVVQDISVDGSQSPLMLHMMIIK